LAAVLLAAAGWFAGILATRHPVRSELRRAIDGMPATSLARRCRYLRARIMAHGLKAREAR
jgi:hypothetical protein